MSDTPKLDTIAAVARDITRAIACAFMVAALIIGAAVVIILT